MVVGVVAGDLWMWVSGVGGWVGVSRVLCLGWKTTTSGGAAAATLAWRLLGWHAAPRAEKSIHASGPPTYARTPLGVSGEERATQQQKQCKTMHPSLAGSRRLCLLSLSTSCPNPQQQQSIKT